MQGSSAHESSMAVSDPTRIWFDGGIIDWHQSGATTHLNLGSLESEHAPTWPYDVDYVTGAGMLLRTRMIVDIGLIPEDWFLYFEETAYNVIAQRRGWRTMVDPRYASAPFQEVHREIA